MRKFKVSDRVIVNRHNKKIPLWVRERIKRFYRIRKIMAIFYDKKEQHAHYYLGFNKRNDDYDTSYYPFRSDMLILYQMKPHTKRLKLRRINKAQQ